MAQFDPSQGPAQGFAQAYQRQQQAQQPQQSLQAAPQQGGGWANRMNRNPWQQRQGFPQGNPADMWNQRQQQMESTGRNAIMAGFGVPQQPPQGSSLQASTGDPRAAVMANQQRMYNSVMPQRNIEAIDPAGMPPQGSSLQAAPAQDPRMNAAWLQNLQNFQNQRFGPQNRYIGM